MPKGSKTATPVADIELPPATVPNVALVPGDLSLDLVDWAPIPHNADKASLATLKSALLTKAVPLACRSVQAHNGAESFELVPFAAIKASPDVLADIAAGRPLSRFGKWAEAIGAITGEGAGLTYYVRRREAEQILPTLFPPDAEIPDASLDAFFDRLVTMRELGLLPLKTDRTTEHMRVAARAILLRDLHPTVLSDMRRWLEAGATERPKSTRYHKQQKTD